LMLKSHLDFTFATPRSFELATPPSFNSGAKTTTVQVVEILVTLPLSSGGAYIDTTFAPWYCSKFDTRISQDMEQILKSAGKP
jgi:hypothetical protein